MLFNSNCTEEVSHDSVARVNAIKSTVLSSVNKSNETCSDSTQAMLRGHYEIIQDPQHIKTLLVITKINCKQVCLIKIQKSLCFFFGLQSHKTVPDKF